MLTAWLRPRSTASVTIVPEELAKRAPRSVSFTSASTSMRSTIWLMSTRAISLFISTRSIT